MLPPGLYNHADRPRSRDHRPRRELHHSLLNLLLPALLHIRPAATQGPSRSSMQAWAKEQPGVWHAAPGALLPVQQADNGRDPPVKATKGGGGAETVGVCNSVLRCVSVHAPGGEPEVVGLQCLQDRVQESVAHAMGREASKLMLVVFKTLFLSIFSYIISCSWTHWLDGRDEQSS